MSAVNPATPTTSAAVAFEGVSPILRVKNMAESIKYYVEVLGFKIDFRFPNDGAAFFASVSRGRCHIFLSEGDQGNTGSWVWIGIEDVDALQEEYRRTGAKIRHPPTNYTWACEMQVEDLDGNVLRMGSESKKDTPIGEWLDMYGKIWPPQPAGAQKTLGIS
ncbi:MAG: glyoxalase superfamily protein [Terriglobales bacterium]|jgi:uncharacterized glyoxalase superfamily protein PhnB